MKWEGAIPKNHIVEVGRLIDESPLSSFQMRILGICFLLSMIEGFDTQAIAFVGPALAKQWALTPPMFGPIFSIGLFGAVVGGMAVGMIQDIIGRRPTLMMAIFAFSALTFITSLAGSYEQLLIIRLLTGIGLGAAVPIIFSYAAEYSPARVRITMVALIVAGFPVGAVLGGIIASAIIGQYGWHAIFWIGGIVPLILIPTVWMFMPETIRFLAIRPENRDKIIAIFKRINPGVDLTPDTTFLLDEVKVTGARFPALFMKKLLPGTILLPIALFSSLLLTYCLINWLPILLTQFGFSVEQALYGPVFYNLSSIVGSLCLTRLIDRIGKPLLVLGVAYIIGCIGVASIGLVGRSFPAVMGMIFVAGLFVVGPQLSLMAFITNFYPTAIRGTGIGWGQGMGRVGSLTGPLLGGYLLSLHVDTPILLQIVSVSALASSAALFILMFFFKEASLAATEGRSEPAQVDKVLRHDVSA